MARDTTIDPQSQPLQGPLLDAQSIVIQSYWIGIRSTDRAGGRRLSLKADCGHNPCSTSTPLTNTVPSRKPRPQDCCMMMPVTFWRVLPIPTSILWFGHTLRPEPVCWTGPDPMIRVQLVPVCRRCTQSRMRQQDWVVGLSDRAAFRPAAERTANRRGIAYSKRQHRITRDREMLMLHQPGTASAIRVKLVGSSPQAPTKRSYDRFYMAVDSSWTDQLSAHCLVPTCRFRAYSTAVASVILRDWKLETIAKIIGRVPRRCPIKYGTALPTRASD